MDRGSAVVDPTNGRTHSLGGLWVSVASAWWDRMRGSTWLFRISKSSGKGMDPSMSRQSYVSVLHCLPCVQLTL